MRTAPGNENAGLVPGDSYLANPTVSGPVLSLNVGPDETSSLVDTLADSSIPAAHATTWDRDLSQTVGTALDLLAPRPRLILRLRYGIGCPRCYTLSEIGVMLSLSAERIRQIQEEAHSILRAGPFGMDLKEMVLN